MNKFLQQGGVCSETSVVSNIILAIIFHDMWNKRDSDVQSVWCYMHNDGKWFLCQKCVVVWQATDSVLHI
jgi:hypothetical protein